MDRQYIEVCLNITKFFRVTPAMTSQEWRDYLRQNRRDRFPVRWDEPVAGPIPLSLLRSLQKFQLGESSDGQRLRRRAWRLAARTGDIDYAEAIELFIAEEQAHARLLAQLLERFGAMRLRRHWSDTWFRHCRHLLGLHEELSVLLMAEIVALKYYSVLWNGTGDSSLRAACEQILHDEKFHVRFHCETLHRCGGGRYAGLLTAMFAGASACVAWDHGAALAALGSSPEDFLDDCWKNFAAARQAILTGEPFVWSRTTMRVESPAVLPAETKSDLLRWIRAVWACGLRALRPTFLV